MGSAISLGLMMFLHSNGLLIAINRTNANWLSAAKAATKFRSISRKGAKAAKVEKNKQDGYKIIYVSVPNLACFAPWREDYPSPLPENLRKPRKLST
jgi:hypothetical protein